MRRQLARQLSASIAFFWLLSGVALLLASTAFGQVIETWRMPNFRGKILIEPNHDSTIIRIAHFDDWFVVPETEALEDFTDSGECILKPLLPPIDLQPGQTTGWFPGDSMQYDFLLLLGKGSQSAADYIFISAWYRVPQDEEEMFAGAASIGEWSGDQAWINNVAQMPDSSIVIHVQYAGNDEHSFWGGSQFFRATEHHKYDPVFSVGWSSDDSIRTYYNADMVNFGSRTMVELTEFLSGDSASKGSFGEGERKIDSVKSRVVDIWDLVAQHLRVNANEQQQ